jgi:thioredoxin reductase (NADPH)
MIDHIVNVSADHFQEEVLNNTGPVIVDFYSEGCPPCQALAPIYEHLAAQFGDRLKFVKIMRQDNRELTESLGINSSPTILFYNHGRETGERLHGFQSTDQVLQAIESLLGQPRQEKENEKVDCDVLILGGGAAGLSAAIYAARAKLRTIVVDEKPGGQAASTYQVANYTAPNG